MSVVSSESLVCETSSAQTFKSLKRTRTHADRQTFQTISNWPYAAGNNFKHSFGNGCIVKHEESPCLNFSQCLRREQQRLKLRETSIIVVAGRDFQTPDLPAINGMATKKQTVAGRFTYGSDGLFLFNNKTWGSYPKWTAKWSIIMSKMTY